MLGLLLSKKKLHQNGSGSNWWPEGGGRMTQSGMLVDEATSLTYSAVFCATRIITEGVAMLPLKLYRKAENGSPSEATDMPQYALTASQPNPDMPMDVFKIGRTMHQVNGGNGFAEIERERMGDPESPPVALWPIEAWRVRPANYRDTDRRGRPLKPEDRYVVRNNDGSSISLKSWEMLHVPGVLSEDGIWGKSIVAHARQDVGAGLAMDAYATAFFSSAKAPPAVIYGAAMRDPEERKAFRKEWRETHGRAGASDPALLPLDAKYERIGIKNDEGQFLQTQQMGIHKIARFWRVPVHMMAEMMGPAGYNSILQLYDEFVRISLMTWLMLWEGQCNQKLLTPEERETHHFAHDLNALLKADPETRAKIREINLRCGHWSLNDSRREDGMPEIGPAGDEHYVMTNMTTADRIYKGLPPPSKPMALPAKDEGEEVVEAEPKRKGLPAKPKAAEVAGEVFFEEKPTSEIHRTLALDAARVVLTATLSRLLTKESKAAERITSKNIEIDAYLDEFYGKHEALAEKELGPAIGLLIALGKDRSAATEARALCAESKRELREAYNTDNAAKLKERLESWPTLRAERVAKEIMGEANV